MRISLSQLSPSQRADVERQLGHTPPHVGAAVFDDVAAAGREIKELHEPFIQILRTKGLLYIHAATHKRSTIQKGWPDFTVFGAHPFGGSHAGVAFIEFKARGGRPSQEQLDTVEALVALGFPVLVTKSLKEAQQFVEKHL